MRLTKKRAVDISIELWEYLAESGGDEDDKHKWVLDNYGEYESDCALCEYGKRHQSRQCAVCPYHKFFGSCLDEESPYCKWDDAQRKVSRKKYAAECVKQLKEIRSKL